MIPFRTSSLLGLNPALRHGFFGRKGGVSEGDFGALNVSYAAGDDPEAVRENRRLVAETMGIGPLVVLKQVREDLVEIGDPILGNRVIPLPVFLDAWPSRAVFVVIGTDFDRNTALLQPTTRPSARALYAVPATIGMPARKIRTRPNRAPGISRGSNIDAPLLPAVALLRLTAPWLRR